MSKELEYFQEIIKVDEEALTLANKETSKKLDVILHRHWLNQRKNVIEQALKEHEQYKAIEEEIGIDLITLFKALKCFYAKDMDIYCPHPNPFYLTCGEQGGWYISWITHNYKISDYGKTWALTKEELEQ